MMSVSPPAALDTSYCGIFATFTSRDKSRFLVGKTTRLVSSSALRRIRPHTACASRVNHLRRGDLHLDLRLGKRHFNHIPSPSKNALRPSAQFQPPIGFPSPSVKASCILTVLGLGSRIASAYGIFTRRCVSSTTVGSYWKKEHPCRT